MKTGIVVSLALRILILVFLALAASAEDGIPIMMLAANGFIELKSDDAWLPDLILRKSLSEKCKVCSQPPPNPSSRGAAGIGKPIRRNSTCDADGTCLLRLGRIGFRPGSICGGDWHLLPGDATDVQASHVFCVCPNLYLGYAICPYATCEYCCQDAEDARNGE
jgi:hypothetical protein